jgi:type IV fimbrial biogenesis protein FimT
MRAQHGMTLLELMITLVVAGILLMIAIPSFVSLTQTNRVAAEINGLSAALQYARAEAVKEGLPVTVCVSSNGTSCAAASTPWQSGWIVFSDANGNQTVDPGDLVLRRQLAWTSSDTFTVVNGSGSAVGAVTYSRDGFATNVAGGATWTLNTSPANASARRCLALNLLGHQQVVTNGQSTFIAGATCS